MLSVSLMIKKLTISGLCGQETERDVLELAIYPYAYSKLRKFYPMSPGDQRPELSVSLVVTTMLGSVCMNSEIHFMFYTVML